MYFTPTVFTAKLLAVMQVLVILDMAMSTTMALPVTSEPIESTVEKLAWEAWIESPAEEKQKVVSRKVTKSIFTLPLRVECPGGHKQVDTKCIPIANGSNDVLINAHALGLFVGNTKPEDIYDYGAEDMSKEAAFGSGEQMFEADEQFGDSLRGVLEPPSNDEPLKFNIFLNKFHTFPEPEEPLEDYSSFSNEGLQSSEKEHNSPVNPPQPSDESFSANLTLINNLPSDLTNISTKNLDFHVEQKKNNSSRDSEAEESKTFSADELFTSLIDTETTTIIDDGTKRPESDIQILLRTESFLPLYNYPPATTSHNSVGNEKVKLTESSASSSDNLNLNLDEEITTVPNVMEPNKGVQNKQEHTRSVTINPTILTDTDSGDADDISDDDQTKDSTLKIVRNDEPLETTTPIQLDETTVTETYPPLDRTPSTLEALKELLLQQEQIQRFFEELQSMRKGQKDQHVVLKKSKVQPVAMLPTTTVAITQTTTAAANSAALPTAIKSVDELIATTTVDTVTPLLTVDNNDRFYHQHFDKQENQAAPRFGSELKAQSTDAAAAAAATEISVSWVVRDITATKLNETEAIPLTSEIYRDDEMRVINELVKGRRPANSSTATTTTKSTITTIKTANPSTATTKTIFADTSLSSTSPKTLSESSSMAKEYIPSNSQIWSKIMPLLTTSSTTPKPKISANESNRKHYKGRPTFKSTASASPHSNRNSKIISLSTASDSTSATTTTTAVTRDIFEESNPPSPTTINSSLSSSTENSTPYPYWWLPLSWRLDKPANKVEQPAEEQDRKSEEEESLLLRFWSTYTPRST